MPQLSQPTVWRSHPHRVNGYLAVANPAAVFSASVNQTISSYPIYEITYDNVTYGAYTDVSVGMTVKFTTPGGAFLGWGRVRLAPTANTLYIGAIPSGDIVFEDDDLFEVLDDYRLWAKIPYIDAADPLSVSFYKDRNLVYTNQGIYPNPVSNVGPHVAGFVGDDGFLYVSFLGETNSYAIADGATIASYANNIDDGTYVTGNSAAGDFDAKFPAGERWVSLTVTDDNGKTHTSRRFVKSCERAGAHAPLQARLADLRLTMEGASASFTVLADDASKDVVPDGTLVIYFEEETWDTHGNQTSGALNCWDYGSLTYPQAVADVKFAGWTVGNSERVDPLQDDLTLKAQGPAGILALLPMFSQTVSNGSVSKWNYMSALTLFRFIWYLLHWHTTALEVCDLARPDWYTSYPYHRFDVSAGTAFSVVDQVAQYVNANLTCDRNCNLFLARNQQFMIDADRDLVETTITLDDCDWADMSIEQLDRDVTYWVRGSGLLASTSTVTPYLSIAPGKSPGQGGAEESFDQQLVEDQDDLNVRTGRQYGLRNTRWPSFSITIPNGGLIADPAWREWVEFVLSPDYTKREHTIND